MIFHSIEYLLLLIVVVCIYYTIAQRYRWVILLTVSYFFYGSWRLDFIPLLLVSTVTDYYIAILLEKKERFPSRKMLLGISIFVNIGLLFFFKYLGTGWNVIGRLLDQNNVITGFHPLNIILPLGISFYTFQTLGYTIDVYRGKIKAERHLGIFATYVTFFPQLLAGPIERAPRLLPQFRKTIAFNSELVFTGLGMILLGLFKKLVISNRLYLLAEPILSFPELHSPLEILLAFPANIYEHYCDISGYTDIAIGSALIMGIRLTKNFDRPFAANSITNFWQRYHITVTRWFRDYVLFPIAGRNASRLRKYLTIYITMLLICLWHGPNWFVPGLFIGLLVNFEFWWRSYKSHHPEHVRKHPFMFKLCSYTIGTVEIFLFIFVISGFIAFGTFDNYMSAVYHIFQPWSNGPLYNGLILDILENFAVLSVSIGAFELWQWVHARSFGWYKRVNHSIELRWLAYGTIILSILTLSVVGRPDFYYFRF